MLYAITANAGPSPRRRGANAAAMIPVPTTTPQGATAGVLHRQQLLTSQYPQPFPQSVTSISGDTYPYQAQRGFQHGPINGGAFLVIDPVPQAFSLRQRNEIPVPLAQVAQIAKLNLSPARMGGRRVTAWPSQAQRWPVFGAA